ETIKLHNAPPPHVPPIRPICVRISDALNDMISRAVRRETRSDVEFRIGIEPTDWHQGCLRGSGDFGKSPFCGQLWNKPNRLSVGRSYNFYRLPDKAHWYNRSM